MRSTTNLLIGVKCNANLSMLNFRMCLKISHSSYNLGNTGLVICSQKSVSIGNNDIITLIILNLGEIGNLKHDIVFFIKYNVTTLIILYDTWLNITTAHVGACIKVCNETHHRHILIAVCRKRCIQITLFVENDILKAHILKLLLKITSKDELAFGCWNNSCIVARLCIESHILEETLKHIFFHIFHILKYFIYQYL